MTQRILVAEDDLHSRELISAVLRVRGYDVVATCDGEEAGEELLNNPPDLAILDIQMPRMSGDELCHSIKANEASSHIPVMLVSACSDTPQLARESGADGYLIKPYSLSDLYEQVNLLLAKAALPRTAEESCVVA